MIRRLDRQNRYAALWKESVRWQARPSPCYAGRPYSTDHRPMSPSDWFSWEFWVETAHSVLSGMGGSWVWARYAVNRENIISLATLIGGAIGFWWVIKRTRAAEKTAEAALKQVETAAKRHGEQTTADRERRITESFATLVEQLGSDKLETRLGGIYTLERISQEKESEREYWPIM